MTFRMLLSNLSRFDRYLLSDIKPISKPSSIHDICNCTPIHPVKIQHHLRLFFFAFAVLLLSTTFGYSQCNPLSTLYAENNGQDGIMFDINAIVDVTITGFDFNMGATTPYNMEIYFKAGTHVGFEMTPGAWTLAGTAANVMGVGLNVPTAIPIALNVAIPAGQTYSFYITDTGSAANLDYTNGTVVGALYSTDGNINVYEGTGKDYPFLQNFAPRIPNTTVYYDCCPKPILVELDNSCSGFPDGSIEATGQGVGPWVYEVSNTSGVLQTSPSINGPYTFIGLIEGQYVVTATDANGCVANEDAELEPAAPMTIAASVTDNFCFGGVIGEINVNVVGGSAPFDIGWSDLFGNILQLNPQTNGTSSLSGLAAGTYVVGALDQAGCQTVDSIVVSEPVSALVLTLTPSNLLCFESGDGQILASLNGVSPFVYDLENAMGIPIGNANNAGNHTFQNLNAGNYSVTVTDANGCEATEDVELTEPAMLDAVSSTSPVLCFNGNQGSASISSISGGTTPYGQTSWNDPTSQVGNSATGLFPGAYTATIIDANGCTLEVDFLFNNPPPLTLNPSYLTDTCGQGKGAAIINVSLGTPPYTYLWKPDGLTTQFHYQLLEGFYEVVVTDANGCTDSAFVEVKDDISYPIAAFDYRIEGEDVLTQEVQFLNNSVGTSQWTWNFGDGESSNEENPLYQYDYAGDYLVQLLASNGFCVDTTYKYVNIDPMLLVYVPNAFTPGINGKNDFFFPQGEGIELESYDMFIYDRWGKLLWQTGNFSKKWDGTNMFTLKEVPNGTYAYLIKFKEFADLDRHEYTGVVHLLRD
ncbi:MAG: gliding motility-associated C-terminal domain-containing protein [Flavobacteriales bacterium]|nr:gliding motility-associated C-terminal domain-containing protein [Flavobacteriales bacterium]